MTFNTLSELAKHIAEDFRVYEDREFVVFNDRDAALVSYVVRCLTNPQNEYAAEVLGRMQRHYEERKEAA